MTHRDIHSLFADVESRPDYTPPTPDQEAALTLARNLLRQRLLQGLTQEALAQRAGMRQPRIAEIESARGRPRFDTLVRVARALEIPLSTLVDGIGSTEPYHATLMLHLRDTATCPERFARYWSTADGEQSVPADTWEVGTEWAGV